MNLEQGLRVGLVEPFFGGSHRAFAEGWATASRHEVTVYSLQDRFWKWRMRGASFKLARMLGDCSQVDVLLATSLVDLAHLKAFLPKRIPTALFFHENQASYPFSHRGDVEVERDLQYVFTDLASGVAADGVGFNSRFQLERFFEGTRKVIDMMPDHQPVDRLDEIRDKSEVLHLGVDFTGFGPPARNDTVTILWNHRWEHDKNPEPFFRTLFALDEEGCDFELIVAGESYSSAPPIFREARARLAGHIVQWGMVKKRADYIALLDKSDVVVSTSNQENFGISVIEAVYAGAHPLVPDRLAYPEVLPEKLHARCIYFDEEDLLFKLRELLQNTDSIILPEDLRGEVQQYDWRIRGEFFDRWIGRIFAESSAVL